MQHTNEEIKIIKKNGSGATLRSSTLKTKVEILDEGYEAKSRKKVILKTCSFVILFLTFMVSSWVSPNSSVSVFITASSSLGLIVCFWFWVIPGVRRANAKTNLINLKGATRILEIEFEERICGNVKISYADSRGTLSEIIQPFQVVENIEKEGIEIDWTNKTITIPWLK